MTLDGPTERGCVFRILHSTRMQPRLRAVDGTIKQATVRLEGETNWCVFGAAVRA